LTCWFGAPHTFVLQRENSLRARLIASERRPLSADGYRFKSMSTEPGLGRQADQTGEMRVTAPTFTISLPWSAAMSLQSGGEAVDQSVSGEGLGQEANCSVV
jgi:hypothetical protein